MPEGRHQRTTTQTRGRADDRYRGSAADAKGKTRTAGSLPTGTVSMKVRSPRPTPKRCGNDGAVETVENQTTGFPPFPQPLGNRKYGDFHIPTAPTSVIALSSKHKHPRSRFLGGRCALPSQIRNRRKEHSHSPACDRNSFRFQAHAALESTSPFRLIPRWNQKSISGSFLDWKMLDHC